MLDEIYEIDNLVATARQHCEEYEVPYSVFLWRKSKGRAGKDLFRTPIRVVHFQGELHTLEMISEKTGIPEDILHARYQDGVRGTKLVRDHHPQTEDGKTEKLKAQCKAHLRALLRAHRERAIALLQNQSVGVVEEPFDYAAAQLNAQRYEEASREYHVRSTGQIWDFAA